MTSFLALTRWQIFSMVIIIYSQPKILGPNHNEVESDKCLVVLRN